jgi:hypothetical protein
MSIPVSVADDEELYRRILADPLFYERLPNGEIRVTRAAFNDQRMRPSVDRARYCGYDPTYTQRGDPRCRGEANDMEFAHSRGVVSLLTQNLRLIGQITSGDPRQPTEHTVDVEYAPLPDNIAHAEIVTQPQIGKKNAFSRLRTALAQIAKWEIYPEENTLP